MPATISSPFSLPRIPQPCPSSGGQPAAFAPPGLRARAQAAAFTLALSDVEWAKSHGQSARHALASPLPSGMSPVELRIFRLQMAFALVADPGFPGNQVPAQSPELAG